MADNAANARNMSDPRPTAPTAATAPPALDEPTLHALAELDPGGGSGLVTRVLRTFLASMARLMEQFTQARAAGDLQAQRHVAHTLKSSSASVGALALSGLCAEVERRVREDDLAGLDDAAERLLAESGRVRIAVGTLLRE